jgi:very-short-patch-repair endonuclease
MPTNTYLNHLQIHLLANNATEHTHRPALQNLLTALLPHYRITNEPRRIACGSPDFEIAQGDVPIGHIEAKDVGIDLDKIQQSEQLRRYLPSLHNLILTDYLEFRWFVNSEYQADMTVILAKWDSKKQQFITYSEQFLRFKILIITFIGAQIITLRSPEELAKKMAHIARLMNDVMFRAYQQEEKTGQLHGQLESFRKVLIDTLTPDQFADMVAQTICYGLFAAKCSAVGQSFSRLTASHFVPKTNPFLRNLFNQIAGIELDERLVWMVDHLVAVLNRADIGAILENFGKRTRQEDPVVHFYETFLAHYDAKLRGVRGVYYTPEPVVSYIVRSVDWVLKDQFGLKQGLADSSTLTPNPSPSGRGEQEAIHSSEKWKQTGFIPSLAGIGVGSEGIIHKVQILDPATGTGTFLYAVIANIYERFRKNQGMWSDYVSKHLLPRVHGFELLMAAYTVAHMKLSLQLKETGYDFGSEERLQVFLTNTLDEPHYSETSWLAKWLSEEANAASEIKQHSPVMVILGNPPYSYDSMNKGGWINQLIRDYYQIDGQNLNERNSKGLQDDYVKFIRFAQWRIQQTGYGVLGFVTNHGYLDNPTFRGMRQALMQDFDEIYILDLHGNSKKKEKSPDGSVDKNVFDIQQGVAIGIFVKHKPSPPTPLPVGEGDKNTIFSSSPSSATLSPSPCSLLPSPSGRGVGGEGKEGKIPPLLLNRARELRKNLTDAEQILWSVLRGQRFLKLKFRRQHPISPYILDFYCHELKLAIEVDGGQHNTSEIHASDTKRTLFLSQLGITVLRFWNNEVIYQFDVVLEAIYSKVLALQEPSPLTPLPKGEGNQDTIFSLSPSSVSALPTSPSFSPPSPFGRGVGGEGGEGKEDKNAKVHHAHLFGERAFKYQYLMENDIKTTQWTTLQPQAPFYLFIPQNTDLLPEYERGWKITDMMSINSTGVKTHRDHFVFDFDQLELL